MGLGEFSFYLLGLSLGYAIGKSHGINETTPRLYRYKRNLEDEKQKISKYNKFIESKGLTEEYKFFNNNITINDDINSKIFKNNCLLNDEITSDYTDNDKNNEKNCK